MESTTRAEPPRTGYVVLHRTWGLVLSSLLLSLLAGVAACYTYPLLVVGFCISIAIVAIVVAEPYVGLLLYTILYMWRPGEAYPVLGALHAERLVGALALLAMYVRQYRSTGKLMIDGSRQTRLLLLVLLASILSVPFAYWRQGALNQLVDFSKLLVWYLLIVHLLNTRMRLRIYLGLFLTLIVKLALDASRAYFNGNFKFAQGIDRAVGQNDAAGDPNALAATIAAAVPILILLVFTKRLRRYRALLVAGIAVMTTTTLLTGSRGGLLGLLTGLVFLWQRSRHRLITGVIGLVLVAACAFALPSEYKVRYETIGQSKLDESSQARIDVWKAGFRMILDRPLTGVGIGCFSPAHALGYSPEGRQNWLQPHNLYVQVPAELGLIGASCFFAFLFEMIRSIMAARRKLIRAGPEWEPEAAAVTGLAAGLFCLLVTGIFGHSFMRYTWYVYGALGIAVVRLRKESSALIT